MTGPRNAGRGQRVADGDLLGLLDQQPDQLVVDRPLDVDPAVGRALLAAEAERRAHDPSAASSRSADREHDRRVLAAHLDDARPREPVEKLRNSSKPTSYEPVNTIPSMPGSCWSSSPTVSPGPITRLNDPVRNARVAVRLEDRDGRLIAAMPKPAGRPRCCRSSSPQPHRLVSKLNHN